VLIFCNPHNPVGRVFTEGEVAAVAELCARRGVVFCSDEIHADLILGSSHHFCALKLGGKAAAHTMVQMAPSKTFNTPGLSCAFMVISDHGMRQAVSRAARGIITEVNAMGYTACAAAFREGEPWRQALLGVLRGNRDFLYDFMAREMPRIRLRPMEATYLAWLDCRGLGLDDPASFFEKGGVGLSDGRMFGPGGEGFVRLNFGCPPARLEEALRRMKAAVESVSGEQ
jgi:cystathionine beta-lyase